MPAKNSLKLFSADSYYHVYNRGVEKRIIFLDSEDYLIFQSYLSTYLLPKDTESMYRRLSQPDISGSERQKILRLLRLNNFSDTVKLLGYCLMPNHFHMLLWQKNADSIDRFMNSLCTRYVMYFNKKYCRVGTLFQDVYKAVLMKTDEQMLYATKYFHRNPITLASQGDALLGWKMYPYSSLLDYLGIRKTLWVDTSEVLSFFGKNYHQSYEDFVTEQTNSINDLNDIESR